METTKVPSNIMGFIEEAHHLDRRMALIGELLFTIHPDLQPGSNALSILGSLILESIGHRRVLESFYLTKDPEDARCDPSLSEPEIEGIIQTLKIKGGDNV